MSAELVTGKVILTKSATSVGLFATLYELSNNAEFMSLFITAIVMGVGSKWFDISHSKDERTKSQIGSEYMQSIFYSIAVIFIMFYTAKNLGCIYVTPHLNSPMPDMVWGGIAAIISGYAVDLVEFIMGQSKKVASAVTQKSIEYIKNFSGGEK